MRDTCTQRIPLEADNLDAGEIRLVQHIEFPELFEKATEEESNYEIFDRTFIFCEGTHLILSELSSVGVT